MAENEDEEDKLRVVSDQEDDTEVVRLEDATSPARPVKLSKQGELKVRPAASASSPEPDERAETEEVPVAAARLREDVEGEWQAEHEGGGKRPVPIGWFVLISLFLIAALAWGALQMRAEAPVAKNPSAASEPEEEIRREDAAAYYTSLERVVRGYFEAESIAEKLRYVRHPERVKPLMEDYYERFPLEPVTYRSIDTFLTVAIENQPFVAMGVKLESDTASLLVEDRADGPLVDW
ncbi:MAG: hypothetical protein ACQKBY_03300, partial [Verrucomicrobiales bacterium]